MTPWLRHAHREVHIALSPSFPPRNLRPRCSVAEQAALLVAHRAVAFAARSLEPSATANRDAAPRFIHESRPVQRPQHEGHRRPVHAQHRRHQVVRERDIVGVDQVANHQQPPEAPLFDGITIVVDFWVR